MCPLCLWQEMKEAQSCCHALKHMRSVRDSCHAAGWWSVGYIESASTDYLGSCEGAEQAVLQAIACNKQCLCKGASLGVVLATSKAGHPVRHPHLRPCPAFCGMWEAMKLFAAYDRPDGQCALPCLSFCHENAWMLLCCVCVVRSNQGHYP